MKRKSCIQELDNKCNPCKILTPNYGPKMGYEKINKEINRKNINEDEKNTLRFIYNENGEVIEISNRITKDKNVFNSFEAFVEKYLYKKVDEDNYVENVKEIKINKNIIIDKNKKIEIFLKSEKNLLRVIKEEYSLNDIILELKGKIKFGGRPSKDKKNFIQISYNVEDYGGLLKCLSDDNSIESSPIIQNILLVDHEEIITKRKDIKKQIESSKNFKNIISKIKIDSTIISDALKNLNLSILLLDKYKENNINTLYNNLNNKRESIESSGYLIYRNSSYFKLNNCINNIPIVNNFCGGICGSNMGSDNGNCLLSNCVNFGEIYSNNSSGICSIRAGFNGNCVIKDCENRGSIYGENCGGICGELAGYQNNGYCELQNCTNYGNICNSYSGGIIGTESGSDNGICMLGNCSNIGNIFGNFSGGICGYGASYLDGRSILNRCINKGNIYGKESGGILGKDASYLYGKCNLNNCINYGLINGDKSGGICGSFSAIEKGECTLINCSNEGNINGENTGGLCGRGAGHKGNCTLIKCNNNGKIFGINSGGLCGSDAGSLNGICSLINCKNNGDINSFNSGGFCGSNAAQTDGYCLLNNCINKGNINITKSGTDNMTNSGGLFGANTGNSNGFIKINNECKNIGLVKDNNNGQLIGSIDVLPKLIFISKTTKILNNPFNNDNEIINFKKGKEDKYNILGDNNNYNLIKQNNFNVKIIVNSNKDVDESKIIDIINTFITNNKLTYDEVIKDNLKNNSVTLENLNEDLTYELLKSLNRYNVKIILE